MQVIAKGFSTGALTFETSDVDPGSPVSLAVNEVTGSTTTTYAADSALSIQFGQFPTTATVAMNQAQNSASAMILVNQGPGAARVAVSPVPLQAPGPGAEFGSVLQVGESILLQKTVDAFFADAPATLYLVGAGIGGSATIVLKFGTMTETYRYHVPGTANG